MLVNSFVWILDFGLQQTAAVRKLIVLLFLSFPLFGDWTRISRGVDYEHRAGDGWDVHITRINIGDGAIRAVASNEADRGTTVSQFAVKTNAIVAINADYFDTAMNPIGMAMGSCGIWWKGDPNTQRRPGLVGVGRRRAEIQQRTQQRKKWMTGAVSGWPMLVSDCAVIEALPGSDHFTRASHPRTAVGLSKDRKTMYLVVADGRKGDAAGPTLPELAKFMLELGACSAMNLDGGGSSAMWVENQIVNRPSDGKERRVGNHLAVVRTRDYEGCP